MAVHYDLFYDRDKIEGMLSSTTDSKQRIELEQSLVRLSVKESRDQEKAKRAKRRERILAVIGTDQFFKLGALILWFATLCIWIYKSAESSDGRYVFSESNSTATVFDKRSGTIYFFQNNKWIA